MNSFFTFYLLHIYYYIYLLYLLIIFIIFTFNIYWIDPVALEPFPGTRVNELSRSNRRKPKLFRLWKFPDKFTNAWEIGKLGEFALVSRLRMANAFFFLLFFFRAPPFESGCSDSFSATLRYRAIDTRCKREREREKKERKRRGKKNERKKMIKVWKTDKPR